MRLKVNTVVNAGKGERSHRLKRKRITNVDFADPRSMALVIRLRSNCGGQWVACRVLNLSDNGPIAHKNNLSSLLCCSDRTHNEGAGNSDSMGEVAFLTQTHEPVALGVGERLWRVAGGVRSEARRVG